MLLTIQTFRGSPLLVALNRFAWDRVGMSLSISMYLDGTQSVPIGM